MGTQAKRLSWVTIQFSDKKGKMVSQNEWLIATNCETMEMRTLKSSTYKNKDNGNASSSYSYPFDKAEITYPTPDTGMMAVFEETCKKIYDPNLGNPV